MVVGPWVQTRLHPVELRFDRVRILSLGARPAESSATAAVRADDQPKSVVMDDFESGQLTEWMTVSGAAGGRFVNSDDDIGERVGHRRLIRGWPSRASTPTPPCPTKESALRL